MRESGPMAGPARSRIKGGVIKARLEFVRERAGEAGLEAYHCEWT